MIKARNLAVLFIGFSMLSITQPTLALVFSLSPQQGDIFGKMRTVRARSEDTFASIAHQFDMGYYELIEANPGVDPSYPGEGTEIVIPSEFILPNYPHKGIIINLAEMRMYYFPKGARKVYTYPVGIGRQDWMTPVGIMSIIEKVRNPTWHVPKSIREARAKEGVYLPETVRPGPDNPLGKYMMRLSNYTYLIHGTNEPGGVGRRSSSGCVRMFPEDIEQLFPKIAIKTPVRIVDEPYKVGWKGHTMYLEAHYPLSEHFVAHDIGEDDTSVAVEVIEKALSKRHGRVDWPQALFVARERQGVPQSIGASWRE